MRVIRGRSRYVMLHLLVCNITLAGVGIGQTLFVSTVGQITAHARQTFPCDNKNSKPPTLGQPRGKHTVTLSWKASKSLSTPLAVGEGYNLYRHNPDDSCTKLNGDALIMGTSTEDLAVDLGKQYGYAVTAFKQNMESKPSEPVIVAIPPN